MSTQAIQNFRVRLKRLRQKKMSQPLCAKNVLIIDFYLSLKHMHSQFTASIT